MKFYLVRHGETDWNRLGRFQGQSDTTLNARGLAQAEDTARAARVWNLTAIYSSPLSVESCLRIVSNIMAELDNGDAEEEFLESVFVLGRKVPMHA